MRSLQIILVCLAALGFILAIISAFAGTIAGVPPEGFSRGCSNLALIAIAISVCCKCGDAKKESKE